MQEEEFQKLFEGYIQNTLSERELSRLMEVMKDDRYDDFLKARIDAIMQEDHTPETIDPQKGELILKNILSHQGNTPEASQPKKRKKRRKRVFHIILSVAAVITVIATGSLFYYQNTPLLHQDVLTNTGGTEKEVLSFTGKQVIHLPDGSTIILNEKSCITYDQLSFNTKTREVSLLGEAYFDIKENQNKPFIVHTGKVSTTVLGTAFNINAYAGSEKIKVTVERGKVQVGDAKKIYAVIIPDQQIVVDSRTLDFEQRQIKTAAVTAWKSTYLILDNLNMEDAVKMISQKYKVTIFLSTENIKKCRITASFLNDEDLDHILKVVCSVIQTHYRYEKDGSITIEGKGCD